MPGYIPPLADFGFLLRDWLTINEHYAALGLEDFDADLAMEVVEQGGKFAADVVAPLNREGDEQGCRRPRIAVKCCRSIRHLFQYVQCEAHHTKAPAA